MVYPPYVWIPLVHTQHKENMLYQTKGVSICPIHLDALYVWMPPYVWTIPICLDTPHVSMASCMFRCPLCLDAPCMLGYLHMFGCTPYVWMMFGKPPYMHITKKACLLRLRGFPYVPIHLDAPVHKQCKESMLCHTKGVSICPHTFGCPCMFRCPHMFRCIPVCLDVPICLDGPICLDAPICLDTTCMFECPHVWTPPCLDDPVWMPLCMVDAPTCLDTPCMFGCPPHVWLPPNVWEHPKV